MNGRRLTVGGRTIDLEPRRDLLRILGALLLATGAVALFLRKGESWAEFPLLLVLLVTCVLLYALGLGLVGDGARATPAAAAGPGGVGARQERGVVGEDVTVAQPWQSVLLVFAIFLVPLTLFQLVDTIGGSTDDPLNQAWIFAVTAAVAGLAAFRGGVNFAALLAGIAVVIAWISLWDKLTDPAGKTVRQLLVIAAIILLVGSVALFQRRLRYWRELVTAAGLTAVAAGVLGGAAAVAGGALSLFGSPVPLGGLEQQEHWNLFLLVVSLVLIVYGTTAAVRGPVYVGGFGLLFFTFSIGRELASRASDGRPDGSLVGWPLLLLLLGAVGIGLGFFLAGEGIRPRRSPPSSAPSGGAGSTASGPASSAPSPTGPARPGGERRG